MNIEIETACIFCKRSGVAKKEKDVGNVHHIGGVENVTDKFKKLDFVLFIDGMYPQQILFECKQQRTELLNSLKLNDEVEVTFVVDGRKWINKQDEAQWFNTLTLIDIKKI